MATSEGIPSSIDIEFLELNDNPYFSLQLGNLRILHLFLGHTERGREEHQGCYI